MRQQLDSCRSRYRESSMSALNCPTADVQWRTNKFLDPKRLCSNRCAHNIYHRIHGADFVEMHALDGSIVNLRLGPSQRFKDSDGSLLRAIGDRRRRNYQTNLRQPTTMTKRERMFVRVRTCGRKIVWRWHFCPRNLARS